MSDEPICREEGCPVAAEEQVNYLGQPRLYCSFHAHRAREFLAGDVDDNVAPDAEVRDGLHRAADDDAVRVYPFDDDHGVANGFLGRRVAYGDEGTVVISMEFDEDSPRRPETVTVEQSDLPELVAALVERADEDHHEDLRERFEAALDRAQYGSPEAEDDDDPELAIDPSDPDVEI